MSYERPDQVRAAARSGRLRGSTAGYAPGFAQVNLVVVEARHADDFHLYCRRNPASCPLLERCAPGDPEPRMTAPGADVRRDLPRYRVYEDGRLREERGEVEALWSDDAVAFLLGCSYTFEAALAREGIALDHAQRHRPVAMYRTSQRTRPAGPFRGPLVVSMRWIPRERVGRARAVTERFPLAHGGPVQVDDPVALGIRDLEEPDYGEFQPPPGDVDAVPVFWACGVTPQAAAVEAALPRVLTHAPGAMLVTDLPDSALLDVPATGPVPAVPA